MTDPAPHPEASTARSCSLAGRFAVLRTTPWQSVDAWLFLAFLAWLLMPGLLGAATQPVHSLPPPDTGFMIAQGLLTQGLPLLLVFWRLGHYGAHTRRAFAPGNALRADQAAIRGFIYALALFVPTLFFSWISIRLLQSFGIAPEPQPVIQWLKNPATSPVTRTTLVVLAVGLAPVTEEVLFRGVLLPALSSGGHPWRALLLTALLFGAIHLHAHSLLPLAWLGLCLGAAYVWTGHLLTAIVMHATLNALNLLALTSLS